MCVGGGGILEQSCYVIYCDARLFFVVLTVFHELADISKFMFPPKSRRKEWFINLEHKCHRTHNVSPVWVLF